MKTYTVTISQLFYVSRALSIPVTAASSQAAINRIANSFSKEDIPDPNDSRWTEKAWEMQEQIINAVEAPKQEEPTP